MGNMRPLRYSVASAERSPVFGSRVSTSLPLPANWVRPAPLRAPADGALRGLLFGLAFELLIIGIVVGCVVLWRIY